MAAIFFLRAWSGLELGLGLGLELGLGRGLGPLELDQ